MNKKNRQLISRIIVIILALAMIVGIVAPLITYL